MNVAGIIMAGGRSSRMGKDKALIELNGQSLLDIAIEKLSSLPLRNIQINRNKSDEPYLQDNIIQDIIADKGPLSGIHAACFKNPDSDLVFLPVDLPLVSVNTLQKIISIGLQQNTNVSVSNNNFPLYLKNSPDLRNTLENQLKNTQRHSVMSFLEQLDVVEFDRANEGELTNVNSPEDLQKAQLLL